MQGGVVAAFECKITLKSIHINEAIKCAIKIRRLLPKRNGTPYKELNSPILFGLLAHSHSWKNKNSDPINIISKEVEKLDTYAIEHPRELLDLICVADLGAWTLTKSIWNRNEMTIPPNNEFANFLYGKDINISTAYMHRGLHDQNTNKSYSPIGIMLVYLIHKLAWENPDLRHISDYLCLCKMSGNGNGALCFWDSSVLSQQILEKLKTTSFSMQSWDEWASMTFPSP